MAENRRLKVFLCHSKEDKPKVRELYRQLVADSFDAWLDEENLLPGQDWDLEIRNAVKDADVVLVCLSKGSTTKAGYVQKETRFALDIADEQPEGAIYLIPTRLEDCSVPSRLSRWQWVDLFNFNGYEKIRTALKTRANHLGIPYTNITTEEEYLNAAIALTKGEEKITISLLQRKLRIGYTRAVRILDAMVQKGFVDSDNETHLFLEPQMLRIPAGNFLMGSSPEQAEQAIKDGADKSWVEREQPQHEVELSEYSIGKYPITNREYQAFVKGTDHKPPQDWDGDQYPAGKGDHPVVYVSWQDAYAFCEWLSGKANKAYCLPTEAEWEKAARGTDGRIWPWGNEFASSKANTKEANIGATTPVGQFSPQGDSIYGCSDMIGNVWEWCNDRWEFDSSSRISKSSHVSQQENNYIVRGGSFSRSNWDARCATRRANRSSLVGEAKGFRVALSPISQSES
jgi:formylglycine-generating enzyme required for sulfatase activity